MWETRIAFRQGGGARSRSGLRFAQRRFAMRLIKYGHSCVRVESDAAVLVIDPGVFTERAALDGVDAVLITHEHADHLDLDALTEALSARPAVRIVTNAAV